MYCNVDIVILLQLVNQFCAFLCWMEQEAFVLCRVFHKNNIGPPNGQRYAPFVEEEWEEGSGMVPGAEPVTVSNGPVDRHLRLEWNGGVSCSEGRNPVVQVCSRSLPVFLGAYLILSLVITFVDMQFVIITFVDMQFVIITFVDMQWNTFIDAFHLIYARPLRVCEKVIEIWKVAQ